MRNTTGNLFSVFNSQVTVTNLVAAHVTPEGMFLYMSHSEANVSASLIEEMELKEAGSLAELSDQSTLIFANVVLRNISSTDHGVMTITKSTFTVFSSQFSNFNMSLITAQLSSITISHSNITDVLITLEGKSLSMLPNGGLISCTDCLSIVFSSTKCRNVSANEGGVVSAQVLNKLALRQVIFSQSTFENCVAKTAGGVLNAHFSTVSVQNCTFSGNSASIGGVMKFEGAQHLLITDNIFTRNIVALDGSCIYWLGSQPTQYGNTYTDNQALYGNPDASSPHHYVLLNPDSLTPLTNLPMQGVTGQQMTQPLLVGVFDTLDQLIVTDNMTLVSLELPDGISASGHLETKTRRGLASFTLLFSPFSTALVPLKLFSSKNPEIANLTVQYKFRDCEVGEIRSEGGCFPCQKNSYSFNPSDPACFLCPPHAVCYGRAEMHLDAEYWRDSNMTDDIYPCLISGACLGGLDQACASGYSGTLCGGCDENYYQYGMWKCRSCEDEVAPAGRGIIIAALLLSAVAIPPITFLRTDDGWLRRLAVMHRVWMNYAHTMLFVVLLHMKWQFIPLVHHEVMRTIGSLGAVLVYSGCQFQYINLSSYYFQVIATAFFPFVILLASVFFWSIAEVKCHFGLKGMLTVMGSAGLIGVYNFLPPLCLMVISMFQCQEVAEQFWLVPDMSQQCWTGKHLYYAQFVGIPLGVFIGAFHGFVYFSLRRTLKDGVMGNFKKYLTSGFSSKCEGWEVQVMVRKLVLACFSLAYTQLDQFSHIVIFACVIGIAVHQDVKQLPYESHWLNLMNLFSHVSIFAIVFVADAGDANELTTVSCLGSFMVLIAGIAEVKYAAKPSKYEVHDMSSVLPSGGKGQTPASDSMDNLFMRVPPSTPLEASEIIAPL